MKLILILGAVLLAIVAVGFFTKPSNEYILTKAREAVRSINVSVPGYSQPLTPEGRSFTQSFRDDQVLIIDKLLWKEVRYASSSNVQLLGYGYLGKFHEVSEKRSQ